MVRLINGQSTSFRRKMDIPPVSARAQHTSMEYGLLTFNCSRITLENFGNLARPS